jgi:hypothetical protein
MEDQGKAVMGTGIASGENRAKTAAEHAIHSPLLSDSKINGARGILINVVGSDSMTLHEVTEASNYIQEQGHEDAIIIWGASINSELDDQIMITVIATGFDDQEKEVSSKDSLGTDHMSSFSGNHNSERESTSLETHKEMLSVSNAKTAPPAYLSLAEASAASISTERWDHFQEEKDGPSESEKVDSYNHEESKRKNEESDSVHLTSPDGSPWAYSENTLSFGNINQEASENSSSSLDEDSAPKEGLPIEEWKPAFVSAPPPEDKASEASIDEPAEVLSLHSQTNYDSESASDEGPFFPDWADKRNDPEFKQNLDIPAFIRRRGA